MNDTKNVLIAWLSSSTTFLAVFETTTVVNILSAVVLPVLFFAIGKTVDVMLQIYLRDREHKKAKELQKP